MSGDLSDYRKEIDRIDDEILRLLNERSKSVVQIGRLKILKDAGANLHTPAREAAIIERLVAQNTGPFPSDAIRPVYREIMSASLSLEGPQKVAYLGPRATFTHMACTQKFGASAQYVPVNSIKEVFSEVERGRANFGVVPIENTTEGVVNHTLDMFIDSNLLIYGEVLQEVSHHLAPIPTPSPNAETGSRRICPTFPFWRSRVRPGQPRCAWTIPRSQPLLPSWLRSSMD
jgi:chorismate mutase/prephenate dehydratase